MSNHIGARRGDIAERAVLPGDPLRARYMAEKYLTDVVRVNEIRNMWGYTGFYKGEKVSIMSTGMGITSMMIYTTELCRDYGCKRMVRVGTSGAYLPEIRLGDILVAQAVSTTSSINSYDLPGHFSPIADFGLLKRTEELGKKAGLTILIGNMLTNERLYIDDILEYGKKWAKYGVIGSECEGEGFYTVAAQYGARAVMMAQTVINYYRPEEQMSPELRACGMDDMLRLSLDVVISD